MPPPPPPPPLAPRHHQGLPPRPPAACLAPTSPRDLAQSPQDLVAIVVVLLSAGEGLLLCSRTRSWRRRRSGPRSHPPPSVAWSSPPPPPRPSPRCSARRRGLGTRTRTRHASPHPSARRSSGAQGRAPWRSTSQSPHASAPPLSPTWPAPTMPR